MATKSSSHDERIDIRVNSEHDRVLLNDQARDVFLKALINPPTPNEALRRAAAKYTVK